MNDSENKTFKERFTNLNETFENIKNEDINLEEAGIKQLNTKIGELFELNNTVRNLAKEVKSNTNDEDLVSDGELLGDISMFIKSLESMSNEFRNAQRGREKLRNKINDEKEALNIKRNEFDFKLNDTLEKINEENQVLGMDLSLVDKKYHESLLNVYKEYENDLGEERRPIDDLYNRYDAELELLLNGGKPNYHLEDNNLVSNEEEIEEEKTIPEIKDEDVISNVMSENEEMFNSAETVPELQPLEEVGNVNEKVEDENIEDIRNEVAEELALAEENNEVKEETINEVEAPVEPDKNTEAEETLENVVNPFSDYFAQTGAEETVNETEIPVEPEALNNENTEVKENLEENQPDFNPLMQEENNVTEEAKEEPFDMLTALRNFRDELDGYTSDDKLKVVNQKEASLNLLKNVTPEVLENATNYMKQYNKDLKEESNVEDIKNDENQYHLREGETLSAEVVNENGEKKTVEIEADGTKTVKDSNGNVLNTEHLNLNESTLNGENVSVVNKEDISLPALEEKQDLMPQMPDFSALEDVAEDEGYSHKLVA